jgi:serine/threonine-protein kinase
MAVVFLAHDPAFGRQVAIKVLPLQFTHDPQFRARFEREARLIATLEHAYIVPVYDYGEEAGQPFIVMRYMPGGTLTDRISGRPMPLADILPIVARIAEALDEAHSRDIVHRDLKPANVMFDTRGHAFLSDFGIAKLMQGTTSLTGSGIIGTPAYMSPEQAVGDKEVDGRADLYSLGVMMYEMLTGHQPYESDTPVKMILKHITEPVPTIDTRELHLPDQTNFILARALAKSPGDRYDTASEFVQAMTQSSLRLPVAIAPTDSALSEPETLKPVEPSTLSARSAVMPTAPSAPVTGPRPTPVTQPARAFALPLRVWGIALAVIVVIVLGVVWGSTLWGGGGGQATSTVEGPTTLTPVSVATTVVPAATGTQPPPTSMLRPSATREIETPSQEPSPTLASTDTPAPTATPLPSSPIVAQSTRAPTRRPPTATQVAPTSPPPPTNPPPTSPPLVDTAIPESPTSPPPVDTATSEPPSTNTSVPEDRTKTPVP